MKRILIHAIILVCALAPALFALDLTAPSKAELYKRARSALLKSVVLGDVQRASDALDYLKSEVKDGAPLTEREEYLIDLLIGRIDDGVRLYVNHQRSSFDSTYNEEGIKRESVEDPLSNYLSKKYGILDRNATDSLVNLVRASDISSEQKELYAVLTYFDLSVLFSFHFLPGKQYYFSTSVRDSACAQTFLNRAQQFIEHFPYSEYTQFLKDQVVPMVKDPFEREENYKKDPWMYKYYTGGLGAFVGGWGGFLMGGASDILESSMGFPPTLEASLQIWRISVDLYYICGLKTYANYAGNTYFLDLYEDESYGINLGYTIYDSRFFKVSPFLGYGWYDFLSVEEQRENGDYEFSVISLGTNVDFRFFATEPSSVMGFSVALIARFKYMAQFGTFKDEYKGKSYDEGFIVQTFGLSMGLYFW